MKDVASDLLYIMIQIIVVRVFLTHGDRHIEAIWQKQKPKM